MSGVDAIKEAIEALPEEDYTKLRQWFSERDWQKWDEQIDTDSHAGTLGSLVKEALAEKRKGKLRNL